MSAGNVLRLPRRVGKVVVGLAVAYFGLNAPSCITSRTGPYAAADCARMLQLASCPNAVVEDAEDANNQILKLEGRGGYWFTFKDDEGSTIEPAGNGFKPTVGGANGSHYAALVSGKLAPTGYSVYAGVGFSIDANGKTYDASKYRGISFMARMNDTAIIRFKTPDVNTKPEGGRCKDCYNDFGVDLEVTSQWAKYTILFSQLEQQRGWGDPAPGVAADALFAVQWQLGKKDLAYELWIDDVQFVGCQ
jgi:endoglucanase